MWAIKLKFPFLCAEGHKGSFIIAGIAVSWRGIQVASIDFLLG